MVEGQTAVIEAERTAEEAPLSTSGESVAPTPAKSAAETDAQQRSALTEAMKMARFSADPTVTSNEIAARSGGESHKEGADGSGTKEAGEPAGSAEAAKEAERPAGAVADAAQTPEARERYVDAIRAMRRDGWSEADAGELLKDPKRVDHALKVIAARQAKTDERMRELTSQRGESRPKADSAGPTGQVESGTDNAATNATDLPAGVLEYLPEAERQALAKWAATKAPKATPKPADPEVERMRGEAESTRAAILEERAVTIQRELSGEFPALKAAEPPAGFLEVMKRRAGAYDVHTREGLADLMRDAALIHFGPALMQQARTNTITKNREARTGSPDATTLRPQTRETGTDRDARDRDALEAAQLGGGNLVRAQTKYEELRRGKG